MLLAYFWYHLCSLSTLLSSFINASFKYTFVISSTEQHYKIQAAREAPCLKSVFDTIKPKAKNNAPLGVAFVCLHTTSQMLK